MVVFVAQWLVGFGSPCRIVVSVFVSGFTGFICLLTKAELMGTEDISLTCKICKIRVNVRLRTNISDRKRPNGGCTVECAGYEWIIGRTKTLPWIRKNQLKSSWVWLQLWKLQFKSLLEVIANANQFEDTRSVKPKHCRLVRPTFAFYMLQTSRNFSLSSHAMGVNSQSNRDMMTTPKCKYHVQSANSQSNHCDKSKMRAFSKRWDHSTPEGMHDRMCVASPTSRFAYRKQRSHIWPYFQFIHRKILLRFVVDLTA